MGLHRLAQSSHWRPVCGSDPAHRTVTRVHFRASVRAAVAASIGTHIAYVPRRPFDERAGEDIMEDKAEKKQQRVVYQIIEKPGLRKPFWMRIGVAYVNQDQSLNVYLDAIPYDRKLNIREEEPRQRYAGNNDAHVAPMQPSFDLGGIQ
jgi:hypothetical protein